MEAAARAGTQVFFNTARDALQETWPPVAGIARGDHGGRSAKPLER